MVAIRQVSVAKKLSQNSHYNASESICYSQERIQKSSGIEVRKRISRKGCLTAQVRRQVLLPTFLHLQDCPGHTFSNPKPPSRQRATKNPGP